MRKMRDGYVKIFLSVTACACLVIFMNSIVLAVELKHVLENKCSTTGLYFTSLEAADYVQKHASDSLFLDVRDPGEIFTIGMPKMADGNAPFRFINYHRWDEKKKTFAMDQNPDFLEAVNFFLKRKGLSQTAPIIIMCSSGRRAPKAANLLADAGYKNVYVVIDGYSGWAKNGLPRSRKLHKNKMFTLFEGKNKNEQEVKK